VSITVYSIEDLMPILRMTQRAIRKLIHNGDLLGRKVGRNYLVTESALTDYLETPEDDTEVNSTANGGY
jgi:excisionase family DNA binding protein